MTVPVALGERAYDIQVGPGALAGLADWRQAQAGRRLAVVTDANTGALYAEKICGLLGLDRATQVFTIPGGEPSKSWTQAGAVLDWLLDARFPRDGALVALGGGVVGDLAGFVAAIYQRGVDFVQVPTTLLAMVDSSVGGKTAVNHPRGKNMIGAFHQPVAVFADTEVLATLPPREIPAGLAEVVKYGLLGDAAFFGELETSLPKLRVLAPGEPALLTGVIAHCCRMKAAIVAADEHEQGDRALLNLGHTFGHAIETFTGYTQWLHGEAVGVGMCMAADLSARLGWLAATDAARAKAAIARAGLPVTSPKGMTPADFVRLMALDKKVKGGQVRLVLLKALGQAVLTADYDPMALEATLMNFCA